MIYDLVGTRTLRVVEQRTGATVTTQAKYAIEEVDPENGRRTRVATPARDVRDARRPPPVGVQRPEIVRDDAVLIARHYEQCSSALLRHLHGGPERGRESFL